MLYDIVVFLVIVVEQLPIILCKVEFFKNGVLHLKQSIANSIEPGQMGQIPLLA